MLGPYVHRIDPVLFDAGGVHFWWYGLGFALGLLELHLFASRDRRRLHLSRREVWSLSLFIGIGILAGGRAVEIAFDEWPFYREHLRLIPAFWLGGMATHGLLLGGLAGAAAFAVRYRKPLLPLAAQRLAFAVLLACCLTIPSNWTQDIPARYGDRHAGLEHSWLYPEIDTSAR